LLGFDWNLIEGFLLAFIRAGTAIALMPVFGYTTVPMQVKAGLGFILALAVAPTATMTLPAAVTGVAPMAGAAMMEAIVGLAIGSATILMLIGAEFAGTLIGLQMGFSMLNVMDPQQEQEISLIGRLEYLLALAIFITLDGHHMLISALAGSYSVIPLGGGQIGAQTPMMFGRLTADVFIVGVKLAAPVLSILLMVEVAVAFIARAMPQMNVFVEAFALKIAVGLISMAVTWPLFAYVLSKHFDTFGGQLIQLIRTMVQ
jgi:flagellar biosynthetic protein FliR